MQRTGLHRVGVSGGIIVTNGKGLGTMKKHACIGKTVFCHAISEVVSTKEAYSLIDLIVGDEAEKCIRTCNFGCLP